ncbi:MAG: hypothetical protein OES12_08900, partial [Anaerolineae bacterium]|nr:hypothetical protein [Anaerolineae bacterium]
KWQVQAAGHRDISFILHLMQEILGNVSHFNNRKEKIVMLNKRALWYFRLEYVKDWLILKPTIDRVS